MPGTIQSSRAYGKPDDIMLAQSQTMRNQFEIYKTDFIGDYLFLNDPFSALWQADIDSAIAIPDNGEERTEIKLKVEGLENEIGRSRDQFQKLASYIRIMFPKSKASQGVFGLQKYGAARYSPSIMYNLMISAHKNAESIDYKADLIALGYVQGDIDSLFAAAESLYAAYESLEDLKSEKKVRTEERVAAYNKVWRSSAAVSAASKQVYIDNWVKLRIFKLYPEIKKRAAAAVQ